MEIKNSENITIISKEKEPMQLYVSELIVKEMMAKDKYIKELEKELLELKKQKDK